MSPTKAKSVLLIAGPTASGKSAVAIDKARDQDGVVINADSMQVYRELRVITARPNVEDEASVPHRLFGHIYAAAEYSTAAWLAEAEREISECWERGKLPIVCGGTGLYFMALEMGLAKLPPIDPEIREKWRNFQGNLHVELQQRHPPSAESLNPADRQRLVRSLEVLESTGKPLIEWQKKANESSILQDANITRIFMDVPRDELYARAERRIDQMLAQGALDEIRALPPLDLAQPLMKAIGVPELLAYIKNEITLEVATTKAKTATRHYIKRQLTWWRGQGKHWFT
ncbi:MAG: tRNA (adenosine(37)-N6)-dimethylallyltransferase MiaA [Alphaproteobacteria bacterium]|nr:tRNA (adenosine(37)-N6)-dimethylallyltransferase MiaA [Alphaproteobacteria bacterium]